MAHLTHALPWAALSTSLTLTKTGPRGTQQRIAVLAATRSPAAEKQRQHFVRAFARTLADFSATERRKYPADPLLTCPDDSKNNNPFVFEASTADALDEHFGKGCGMYAGDARPAERVGRAAWWIEGDSGYACALARVVMAMVATGQVLPLLRLARWRGPRAGDEEEEEEEEEERSCLMRYWQYPGADPGWKNVLRSAMEAYVWLNVMVCWEELWMVYEDDQGKSGAVVKGKGRTAQRDYRDDRAFTRVVSDCTRSQDGDTWTIPHREFFRGCYDYESSEQLKEMGVDPVHPAEMERLREYLKMCWEHLVRVHMVLAEAGEKFDWEYELKETICVLWGKDAFPNLYEWCGSQIICQ